jgi:hypothetical protein
MARWTDCFGREVDLATFQPPWMLSETKVEIDGQYVGYVSQYDAGWTHSLRSHGRLALASFHDAWLDLMIEHANHERAA